MSLPDILSIILIALSLSADCFAVALAGSVSIKNLRMVQVLRTAFTFGLAQAVMPVIGWLIGRSLIDLVSEYDHWVAFGLLTIIGGRMIWEALHEEEENKKGADISRGWLLLTLAVATSIDSLAVGLSFPTLGITEPGEIVLAVSVIGVTAFLITILGFYLGRKAGKLLGERAKIIGGIILIGIGIRVLLNHLLG